MNRKASRAIIRYVSSRGVRRIRAHRSHGRLRASLPVARLKAESGEIVSVVVRQKIHGHWRSHTRLVKVC
jgi:hypothetical protein